LLSKRNLELLREYWKEYRPNHSDGFLFYARSKDKHTLTTRSVVQGHATGFTPELKKPRSCAACKASPHIPP
ncbi:MAG: hypothetical protein PHE79_10430, partial [Eubacteriales bacterium]|nr:hypothetical protein [Eubacteriales bacterium]